METLSRNGAQYRTKLMPLAGADRFAACLRANARFDGVSVCRSERARNSAAFYVTFVPSSPEKRAAILDRQQNRRAEKALVEGNDYVFAQDDSGAFWWCFNPHSGQVYEVTPQSCSCPDAEFRCRQAGVACKHTLALLGGLGRVEAFSGVAVPSCIPQEWLDEECARA